MTKKYHEQIIGATISLQEVINKAKKVSELKNSLDTLVFEMGELYILDKEAIIWSYGTQSPINGYDILSLPLPKNKEDDWKLNDKGNKCHFSFTPMFEGDENEFKFLQKLIKNGCIKKVRLDSLDNSPSCGYSETDIFVYMEKKFVFGSNSHIFMTTNSSKKILMPNDGDNYFVKSEK